MAAGRGLMLISRINVDRTLTSIVDMSPSSIFCGDTIYFTIDVANLSGITEPSGNVSVIDGYTGDTITSGVVTDGYAYLSSIIYNGSYNFIAEYEGVLNQFTPSISDGYYVDVNIINTTTTLTTVDDFSFCYHTDFDITARITQSGSSIVVPLGIVQFRLYSDNDNYIDLPSGIIDIDGLASSVIEADSTTPGADYWIQAIYLGQDCFNVSQTPSGLLGKPIHSSAVCL